MLGKTIATTLPTASDNLTPRKRQGVKGGGRCPPSCRQASAHVDRAGFVSPPGVVTAYIDQIRKAGRYDDICQAFAVLLPVKTAGVMGDGRTYEYVVGLRAVTSTDGMTADFYSFDMKFLGETATRIINEVMRESRNERLWKDRFWRAKRTLALPRRQQRRRGDRISISESGIVTSWI
jgi:hypothetical protein